MKHSAIILFSLLLISLIAGCSRGIWTTNIYADNKVYGSMGVHDETPAATTLTGSGVYNNVTAGMGNRTLIGFNYSTGVLTAKVTGEYLIINTFAFSGSANQEYHLAIGINGVENNYCHTVRVIGTGADTGAAGFACEIHINAGDEITSMIENEDSGNSAFVTDLQLNVLKI